MLGPMTIPLAVAAIAAEPAADITKPPRAAEFSVIPLNRHSEGASLGPTAICAEGSFVSRSS